MVDLVNDDVRSDLLSTGCIPAMMLRNVLFPDMLLPFIRHISLSLILKSAIYNFHGSALISEQYEKTRLDICNSGELILFTEVMRDRDHFRSSWHSRII